MSLWKPNDLALAIDPTTLSDRLSAIVASVVYRGCAVPVAWVVMPGNKPGKWIDSTVELLDLLRGTIIAIWVEGQAEPWIALTDLPPSEAGASWRSLRFWIETGFNALKSVGWQWHKTRRTGPAPDGV